MDRERLFEENSMNRIQTKVLLALLVTVAGAAAYLYLAQPQGVKKGAASGLNGESSDGSVMNARPAAARLSDRAKSSPESPVELSDKGQSPTNALGLPSARSPQEELLARIDELIADDDLNGAYALAKTLMNSADSDVRQDVLATFGWIGLRALPEISLMLKDKDADVASAALHQWEMVVSDIEDDSLKVQILTAGIKVIENQSDAEGAIMMLDSLDSELGVRAVVDIIQNGTPVASEVAREHYEFMTDHPFTTPEAAEAWIAQEAAEQE